MNLARDIDPFPEHGSVRVVIETPAGASVKLKYDEAIDRFVWSRKLTAGVVFPWDFGFVPQTLAGDGDGFDVFVYGSSGGYPGVIVEGRIVGALKISQRRDDGPRKDNHRLLVVPAMERSLAGLLNPGDFPRRVLDELEAFADTSLALTGKQITINGWADAALASELALDAHKAFIAAR